MLELGRGGQIVLECLRYLQIDLLAELFSPEIVCAVLASKQEVVVNDGSHEGEDAIDSRYGLALAMLASLESDKNVQVLLQNASSQVLLLLGHLNPHNDLLAQRQISEHLSLESA